MKREKFNLIDCTLRDGGYYNNWEFARELVIDYLNAMELAQVDYVELGLRNFDSGKFHGPYYYTTDNYLNTLNLPMSLKYAVMVNASELMGYKEGCVKAVDTLFVEASKSAISLVRVACHFSEITLIKDALKALKAKGYKLGLNLMQISDRTLDEIRQFIYIAHECNVDVLYFADSTGSLLNVDVEVIVKAINRDWAGGIGIHAHNNMGHALSNSLVAISLGATWVDSTVMGMGRGPGNLETENILLAAMGDEFDQRTISPVLKIINKYFQKMKSYYGWGQNPYYYLSGKYGIHPTYIQEMLSDKRYDEAEILATINYLKSRNSKKFAKDTLTMGRYFYSGAPLGTWRPRDYISGRDVLLIGSGDSVRLHADGIEAYIKLKNPIVIALNDQSSISPEFINYRAVCHPFRITSNISSLAKYGGELVIPYSQLFENKSNIFSAGECLDFGVSIGGDQFEYFDYFANIPAPLAVGYALAIASSGNANHIYLAGFDGYDYEDPRFKEMEMLLMAYAKSSGSVNITSITATKYKIAQSSIYAT
jgi:4-hydroxy 2-oxovalerate aldolase